MSDRLSPPFEQQQIFNQEGNYSGEKEVEQDIQDVHHHQQQQQRPQESPKDYPPPMDYANLTFYGGDDARLNASGLSLDDFNESAQFVDYSLLELEAVHEGEEEDEHNHYHSNSYNNNSRNSNSNSNSDSQEIEEVSLGYEEPAPTKRIHPKSQHNNNSRPRRLSMEMMRPQTMSHNPRVRRRLSMEFYHNDWYIPITLLLLVMLAMLPLLLAYH